MSVNPLPETFAAPHRQVLLDLLWWFEVTEGGEYILPLMWMGVHRRAFQDLRRWNYVRRTGGIDRNEGFWLVTQTGKEALQLHAEQNFIREDES